MDGGWDDRDLRNDPDQDREAGETGSGTGQPPREASPPREEPPTTGGTPPGGPPLGAPPGYGSPPPPSGPGGIPWEQRDRIGFFPALIETIKQSLFQPSTFFSRLPPQGPVPPPPLGAVGSPLLFAILVGVPAVIMSIYWQSLLSSLGLYQGGDAAEAFFSIGTTVLVAALSPVWIPISILITAAVIHLFLMLVGGAREGFLATFRVLCYASAPELFQLVPVCGGLVSTVWWLVIAVIGLKEVHRTTLGRSLAAVLLPALVCCGIVLYMLMLAGVAGWLGLQSL